VTSLQDIMQGVVQLASRVVRLGIQSTVPDEEIAVASCWRGICSPQRGFLLQSVVWEAEHAWVLQEFPSSLGKH